MRKLFAGAYLVTRGRQSLADDPSPMAQSFYEALRERDFPYDLGDDPAFFSARYHRGPVTWGVCRTDVRRMIQIGDWMAFFAAEKEDRDSLVTRYRFTAAFRVERKISQMAVFNSASESKFRGYLNLLIRRQSRDGWEHLEPCLRKADWHRDWLWRISERTQRRLYKRDFISAGDKHRNGSSLSLNGRPAPVAKNYVIFSTTDAIVARDPPPVAAHKRGERSETWKSDHRSKLVRRLVFGEFPDRCLRTTNRQQPHRHIQRDLDDPAWADELRAAIL